MTFPEDLQALLYPLAVSSALVMVVMVATWLVGRTIRNFSIVDPVWSLLFGPVAFTYAILGNGDPIRRTTLAIMVGCWSLRLGLHLARRVTREHPIQDPRYAALQTEWGHRANARMLGFYLLQGILIIPLSAPMLLPVFNRAAELRLLEYLGIAIYICGLICESVSDAQLARFKQRAAGSSVCRIGLWRYSRHPNYFCEWLVWVGFATFALPSPGGWIGLIAPLLMLYLLLNVTGIPMTEKLAVARKGAAYRHYQQTTSRFVPWPPKRHD